jgi:protein O-mannosyl-transferase
MIFRSLTCADKTSGSVAARTRRSGWLICIALAGITLAVFGRTVSFGFVNYDDNFYVYEAPAVMNGLTPDGMARAFTQGSLANWDPLTTLSHALDYQIYGLNAGGHHLTNVLLHMASVVLLFLALRKLTGATWRSALVAALFAIHPLRAESVAWVTERKDVLSGLFFMLTLGAYARYVEGPPKLSRYLAVVACFVMGLMSKAMLVTMPAVLLVLDYWPLGRCPRSGDETAGASWTRLLAEKIPLFALSAAAGVVNILTQKSSGAISTLASCPMGLRLENAVVSVATYLWQMFCPVRLAALYPFPLGGLPAGLVVVSILVVAGISAAVISCRRARPYLLAGWLWYLVMLLPVIGLIQAGSQAHADRYTYLPQIGLYFALAWTAGSWLAGRPHCLPLAGGLAGAVIAVLAVCAFNQASYWRDSETLWRHDLACAADSALARNDLGLAIMNEGRRREAMDEFRKALALQPDYFEAHNNLGLALVGGGQIEDAMGEFRKAIQAQPDRASAHNNLGSALLDSGQVDQALAEFQVAIKLSPDYAQAHNNLSRVLVRMGRLDEAIAELQTTLKLQPGLADSHFNLGNAFMLEHRAAEAMEQYQMAVKLDPNLVAARYDLAILLWRQGQLDEAIAQFNACLAVQPNFSQARRALELIAWNMATSPNDSARDGGKALALAQQLSNHPGAPTPTELATLAAAYAELGQYTKAALTVGQAKELAGAQTNLDLVAALQQQAETYQSGRPFRDTGRTNGPTRP